MMIDALWLIVIVPICVMMGMLIAAILGINDDDEQGRH